MIMKMRKLPLLVLLLAVLNVGAYAQWIQAGSDIDGENAGDEFGGVVSLSNDGLVMAVGATRNDGGALDAGHVRVFENINGAWVQQGASITGLAKNDLFGFAVSLSGDGLTLAVGAVGSDVTGGNAGAVTLYQYMSNAWSQVGNAIYGEGAGDLSGCSVSLNNDGSIVAIGGRDNDGAGANHGHARVFENNNGSWIQLGADIDGTNSADYSGFAVSLSGDGATVAVGAPGHNGGGDNWGQVRVFNYLNNAWAQVGGNIIGEGNGDESGGQISLSNDGMVVAIAARNNDGNGAQSGHVRVYKNTGNMWTQVGLDIDGEASPDYSGYSVSINGDGSIVAIGAAGNDGFGGTGANFGHVRVYQDMNGTWVQTGADIDGEAVADGSGVSVALDYSGAHVVIGAAGNDGGGSNAGHVRAYTNTALITNINEIEGVDVLLYPNPLSAQLNIDASSDFKSIEVFDITGDNVKTIDPSILSVSIADLPEGTYFLQLQTDNGVITKSFVKQ